MTIYGKPLFIGSATPKLPDIFGDGSDGDLVIQAGDTVTLPVPVPHQSVVEMNYKSITIEAGAILTTSDPNAGLVLRCQGDCVIHGTIDQSGKAPKTNPDSTYQYPEELQCGDGGNGGAGAKASGASGADTSGGTAMSARPYGGGYGAGGGGGTNREVGGYVCGLGRPGGSSQDITIIDENIFIGGIGFDRQNKTPTAGEKGGGGGGGGRYSSSINYFGGDGGTGPGSDGGDAYGSQGGGGGGAGNYGGGVCLLFVGGNVYIDGTINCSGLAGGNGGFSNQFGGGGGGGGGGGSIYILHRGTQTVTGSLNVNGGSGGQAGGGSEATSYPGSPGSIGTATVKQYTEEAA